MSPFVVNLLLSSHRDRKIGMRIDTPFITGGSHSSYRQNGVSLEMHLSLFIRIVKSEQKLVTKCQIYLQFLALHLSAHPQRPASIPPSASATA